MPGNRRIRYFNAKRTVSAALPGCDTRATTLHSPILKLPLGFQKGTGWFQFNFLLLRAGSRVGLALTFDTSTGFAVVAKVQLNEL